MSNNNRAEVYQRVSGLQRDVGKGLILNYIRSCPGQAILDLGCGTGELWAHLAEIVGQEGNVVAVDPDIGRVHVAQETHKGVKNLAFHEGSTAFSPGMSSETYDVIFCNAVLHSTSFPGSLFSASLGRWKKDPGCSWSRDNLWYKLFHRGRVNQ